jgi:hypothetical protein
MVAPRRLDTLPVVALLCVVDDTIFSAATLVTKEFLSTRLGVLTRLPKSTGKKVVAG